jgi:translation initiation factor IF-3
MAKDKASNKKTWVHKNEQIRIPQVLVIQDGKNLGVMSNRDALQLARDAGLDLVEVAPHSRPPVCQIMDYGKYMYEKQKREKTKQDAPKEKQIDFRYVIGNHDLETKANQIKSFIEKGMKVKCVCKFEKREKVHKDLGFDLLRKLIEMLKDVASVDMEPKYEGANVVCRLDMKREKKGKKKE